MPQVKTLRNVVLLALSVAMAAGCGKQEPVASGPRPVLVVQPGGGALAAVASFAGEVRAREESPLAFRIGGNLVRRHVGTGDRVRRGQLLAELDPGDQQLQVQAAQAELARLDGDLARYHALLAQQLVSQSAYDAQLAAWKAAKAQYDVARNQAAYSRLLAPRDGVIASRSAEAGQVVAAGQAIFTLAADSGRDIAFSIPENRIREFHVGMPVQVELWNAPGRHLAGSVRELSAAADPATRTYAARVALAGEAAAEVELGQSARVFVAEGGQAAALSVPLSAVQRGDDGGTLVWVVDPRSGKVAARKVELGPYGEEAVPVRSGLQGGEWVVAAGGHLLAEGQAVAPVDRDNRPVLQVAPAARASTAPAD